MMGYQRMQDPKGEAERKGKEKEEFAQYEVMGIFRKPVRRRG